jgi:hypothetical protein
VGGRDLTPPAAFSRHLGVVRDAVEQEQEWEFFCECGCYGCDKRVKLTVAAYRALHDGGGYVLAPGHQCSERERSQELREEAKALRAQADLQVRRAKKNLRWIRP